ncbi:MAG: ABC transporter permease [Jiangellales bacterium]
MSATTGGLLGRQTSHELVGVARTPVVLFFALAFPVVFFVILAAFVGNETIDLRSGVRVSQFLAPAFASFGIAMATFSFLAIGFAEIRFNGVLKRFTGSPLPWWVLLGGRVLAGTLLAFVAVTVLLAIGVLAYDLQILWERMPAALVTIVVAAMSFSALGLAVAALAPSAQAAIAIANGIVIPLAFLSDMFVVGELPQWLATIGWFFPLKHLVNALGDAFNPFIDTSGLYLDHLAVIVVWGVVGALLALWGIRRETARAESGGPPESLSGEESAPAWLVSGPDARPRRAGRPSPSALVSDQLRHANAVQWRDWSSPFFGIAFPALFVMLLPTVFAADDPVFRLEVAQTVAASMTIYGAAVISYVNMPQGLAEARDQGVLKRWAGTPLPTWAIFGGRAASSVWLALLALLAVYLLAVPVYGVTVPSSWPSALLVLVVSVVCFAALGMAVVSLVHGAQSALAICLGSLITLSFFSDIFIVGAEFPRWLDVLSYVFPLRHAVNAFTDAMAADAAGWVVTWPQMAVVVAWGLGGLLVTLRWFSSAPRGRPPAAGYGKPAPAQGPTSASLAS